MSNYKTHAKFNIFVALPLLLVGIYFLIPHNNQSLIIFGAAFTYATLFMSPDMDLAHQIKFWSIRGLLTAPFRLYSKVFSHRGLSHSILFGTLTRVGYIALLVIGCLWVFTHFQPSQAGFLTFLRTHQTILTFALAGVFLADLCHLVLDI